MSWMTDERAAAQILRGLADDQNPDRWKIWLRYGFVLAFAGVAVGGTFLKMRWLLKPQRKQGPPRYGSDPVRQSSPLRSPSAHSDSGMRPRTHCSDTDVGETAKLIDRCNP